ncbi:MAG: orotate phosphoribosyltransferase [Clostridia bacterium]|jgi:orotate phosphoribosyltransferase
MLSEKRIKEIFQETGVMQEGHFLLTSGRHSGSYLQCARLFQYPDLSELLCIELANKFGKDKVDIVIGPAVGGIIISYEMGRILGARAMFAERESGIMTLRRGFTIPENSNVLIVEDVITTGSSVKEVMELVHDMGARLAGVGVMIDRTGGNVDLGVKMESVITLELPSYSPEECPFCKKNQPLEKPGSRNL